MGILSLVMIYHFYIELQKTNPLVWRRVVVSPDYTFSQMHLVIQAAFGWGNYHLFRFSKKRLDPAGYGLVFKDEVWDDETEDASKTKIKKVFKKAGQKYTYVYDFGDDWLHTMKLEKIEEKEFTGAYCTDGAGACPPEDVGGVYRYQDMLELLAGKKSAERKEMMEWLGLGAREQWKADYFSQREANVRLGVLEL